MISLSQILNDLASDCKIPQKLFLSIWEGIRNVLRQREIKV